MFRIKIDSKNCIHFTDLQMPYSEGAPYVFTFDVPKPKFWKAIHEYDFQVPKDLQKGDLIYAGNAKQSNSRQFRVLEMEPSEITLHPV